MTDIKEIIQSPIFAKQKKKLHKQQIKDLDEAVKSVFNDPTIGDKGVEKYYLAICCIYNIFRLLSLITTKNCIRA